MSDVLVIVRVTGLSAMTRDFVTAVEDLVNEIERSGQNTELEVIPPIPGRPVNFGPIETVALFVASSAGGAVINRAVDTLFNLAKPWAMRRHRKREQEADGRRMVTEFKICGPRS